MSVDPEVGACSDVFGERHTCLFMVPMALVTPFMACAIELLDLSVWILRDTAWMLARISTNLRT